MKQTRFLLAAAAACFCGASQAAQPLRLGPARFWAGAVASAPRVPLVHDVDGDGRDDIIAVDPRGRGSFDVVRTSSLGKPVFPVQAQADFAPDARVVVAGPFGSAGRAAVLAVLPDGRVQVCESATKGAAGWDAGRTAGQVPADLVPAAPAHGVCADVDGDGAADAVVADARGRVLLLQGADGAEGSRIRVASVRGSLKARALGAGDLDGDGDVELVWMDAWGRVWRAGLEGRSGRGGLSRPVRLGAVHRTARLAVGRFRGGKADAVIAGDRLLTPAGSVALADAPPAEEVRGDCRWHAADLDGDGQDELLRFRRSGAPHTGDDVLVHVPSGAAILLDGDNDGLPDAWETGAVKPSGLDLAALGCKPGSADILVEVQRLPDMPEDRVRSEMDRVAGYYAKLPTRNPDETTGVRLHAIVREPVPEEHRAKPWWDMGAATHPDGHRGVTHWMAVYNGGGGQSSGMSDRGSCGGGALYATFIHEFGHQLGLGHTGFWSPAWCPIYPSLMNYAYSYQLGGKGEAIAYSDGRLVGLALNESSLSERLPLPMERVAFLAGPPYHFRLKPAEDGKATLIDWNWNGVFGERRVAADINYGYSTSAGLRHTIGKTYAAPAPVLVGKGSRARLAVIVGALAPGAQVPAAAAAEQQPGLSPERPGRLRARMWLGHNRAADGARWSDEFDIDLGGVTGDPSAATVGGQAWVAYPSVDGVRLRALHVQGAALVADDPVTVPGTLGCAPTIAAVGDGLALLLWRGPEAPVGLCRVSVRGRRAEVGPEAALGFTSTAPVGGSEGARIGRERSLWVGLSQNQDAGRPVRWQVRQLALGSGTQVRETAMEWIGGDKGQERGPTRIALFWEPDRALGPRGQLHFFGGGLQSAQAPWSCHFVATRVADQTVNGGWLTRRFYDEWTQSRSAPGVCRMGADLVFASRWFGNVHGTENDNLFVAFYGRGIEDEKMGDFDDIAFVRDVGISHSIAYVTR